MSTTYTATIAYGVIRSEIDFEDFEKVEDYVLSTGYDDNNFVGIELDCCTQYQISSFDPQYLRVNSDNIPEELQELFKKYEPSYYLFVSAY
jgi:hypothetical protein